jgi:hypothetical protein
MNSVSETFAAIGTLMMLAAGLVAIVFIALGH